MRKKTQPSKKPSKKRSLRNIREIYSVWYEYLKRSADYKEYCEWERSGKKQPMPTKIKKAMKTQPIPIPKEWHNYGMLGFGDIYETDFEQWWEEKDFTILAYENRKLDTGKYFPVGVEYYIDWINRDFEDCIAKFKIDKKREPTLAEFQKSFIERMKTWSLYHTVFIVENRNSQEFLIGQFKEKVKEIHEKNSYHSFPQEFPGPLPTTNYFREDLIELKRYLLAYDLNLEGFSIEEIARIILTGQHRGNKRITEEIESIIANKDTKDQFRKEINFAEHIIKNVEWGRFPGAWRTDQKGEKFW